MILQRNNQQGAHTLINFKELAHVWRLASPKSEGQASKLGTQGRAYVAARSEGTLETYFLLPQEASFFLSSPSTDWLVPTHTMESNLFYSQSSNLNINHI